MPFWGLSGDKQLKTTSTVGITESGKREVSRFSSRGPAFEVLAALEDKSPQTVTQIAETAQMQSGETIKMLEILKRQGYIRFTGD